MTSTTEQAFFVETFDKPDCRQLLLYGRAPVKLHGPVPSPSPTRVEASDWVCSQESSHPGGDARAHLRRPSERSAHALAIRRRGPRW